MTPPSEVASNRREQRGWYFYDWANSAFATTVVALFFGPYLTSLARNAAEGGPTVEWLGLRIPVQSVWPYLVSVSVLTQVIALPLLGGIADYGRRKREMLAGLAYLGAFATMAMFLLEGPRYVLGCALFLIANFCLGASVVIYNAFLPEIANAEERDAVSSRGWGLGYLGGGLLLALNLVLYGKAAELGITEGFAVRLSLFSAGLWWAVFTIIPLLVLRNRGAHKTLDKGRSLIAAGTRQLLETLSEVRRYPQTLFFLLAYLIYNDGIQTVLHMATHFGQEELRLPMSVLTTAILLAQIVAFFGALAFNWLAGRIGSRYAVMTALVIWSGTLIYIYSGVSTATEFYIMAGIVGAIMGGSQALSRSIYSFMIPQGREAEYFSLYEISDKGTSWLGPLFLGLALQWTGSYRLAILSLIAFFLIGLALLAKVDVRRGALEAGNEPPVIG